MGAQLHTRPGREQDGSHIDVAFGGVHVPVVTRPWFAPDVGVLVAEARQRLDLVDLVVVCLLLSSEHPSTLHRALGAHGIAVGIHVVELRGMVDEEAL